MLLFLHAPLAEMKTAAFPAVLLGFLVTLSGFVGSVYLLFDVWSIKNNTWTFNL